MAGLDTAQIKQLIDGPGEILTARDRRRQHPALPGRQGLGPLAEEQEIHPERRQGRLELVRDERDELRPELVQPDEIGHICQHDHRPRPALGQRRDRDDRRREPAGPSSQRHRQRPARG